MFKETNNRRERIQNTENLVSPGKRKRGEIRGTFNHRHGGSLCLQVIMYKKYSSMWGFTYPGVDCRLQCVKSFSQSKYEISLPEDI